MKIRSTLLTSMLLSALVVSALAAVPTAALADFCEGSGDDCVAIRPNGDVVKLKKTAI